MTLTETLQKNTIKLSENIGFWILSYPRLIKTTILSLISASYRPFSINRFKFRSYHNLIYFNVLCIVAAHGVGQEEQGVSLDRTKQQEPRQTPSVPGLWQ